ncbi:MAG TPA: family 10 glycosylhydrolase [Pirellulales bacterium]|nr:family 10 glycosylhydrolase [Pirellulales bacterium]
MRLRLEWGGGREQLWRGTVALDEGALSAPTPLGIEADEPASIWIDSGNLRIQPRSARAYDGVDLDVTAPLTAMLRVNLSGAADAAATDVEVPLAQVAHEPFAVSLDALGSRLLVRRVPGDRLRVKLPRDSVIFSTGEIAEVELQPHLLGSSAGGKVLMVAQLFAARTARDPLWSFERELPLTPDGSATEPAVLPVKLPEAEGIYDLRIVIHRRALQNRLGWKQTVDERKLQFVVLAKERPRPAGAAPLPAVADTLFEIDPANPAWWERWTNVPIPGLRRGPLGNGDAAPWQHSLGSLTQLGPGGREPNVSWEAFPLPIARPGQPHFVEVEYPADLPQTLGISIVEPNTAGHMTPIGLDTGIDVPDTAVSREPRLARHRVAFWPRTKAPLLLLTNQREGSRAAFGKVRVIGPKAAGVSNLGRDTSRPAYLPSAFPANQPGGNRLLAAYYDRPLFPENFSASEAYDEWSGRGLDDWVTYYEGAARLVEYLQYVGYNGLVMTVLADGSTIYPSKLLQPTPRYDTGAYFVSGQDPYRKDILELLFRLFDREGMQLIPALQFAAPLPALEEELRRLRNGEKSGIVPVDAQGRSWLAVHGARKGLAPYYNPLNVRVQDEMLAVVRELCERYQHHAAFSGLALHLAADGYAQLPGADWCYDEQTVDRFVHERELEALVRQDHAARVQAIASEFRAPWLEWRSQALNQLHRRMQAEMVRVKDAPARLYLAGAHLFDRPDIQQALRPSLRARTSAQGVLLSLGIDPKLCQESEELVLARPQWIEPVNQLVEQGVEVELNQSAEIDRAAQARTAAALFFHEPQQLRLPSFDAKSPFKGAQTLLVGQPAPAGALNRQRFVHAIATLDAATLIDGGWLLPLGAEESLAEMVATYRELPAAPFETVAGTQQPVTIRRHSTDAATYVYFTNDSPWQTRVTVEVETPSVCQLDRFGKTRRLPALSAAGAQRNWVIDLEPFELLAGRFSSPDVQLAHPQVSFAQDVENDLYLRIRELGERVAALQQPQARRILVNAGFEQPPEPDNALPGWTLREHPGAAAECDTNQKRSGEQSLRFSSTQAAASLVSAPITPLPSGHLSVLAWLRVADPQRQPPLRLAVSARWKGQDYYRYAPVGAGTAQAISGDWTQFLFEVRDLPTEQLSDLCVRFDLTGPGELWIDDIELREFDDQEFRELKKMITVASYMLESRQLGDCMRLLDGYWPRFLVANVPLAADPLAARPRYTPKRTDASAPVETEAKPGIMERMRRAMPSMLR